jgi:hypothetical protein
MAGRRRARQELKGKGPEEFMIAKRTIALPLWAAVLTAGFASQAVVSHAFAEEKGVTPFGLVQADRLKAFAGLPNWSGLWNPVGSLIFDLATADPKGATAQTPGDRIHPPYSAEWEAKYKAKLDRTLAGYFTDAITSCLPHGMPRLMGGIPGPLEFVVTPEVTYIIWEYGPQVRRIYTDGRGHLPEEDRFDSWNGHSIGHWEGDTLVVDTVSMRDDTPFDRTGAPHSNQVHLIERMRLIDGNVLENNMIIEDPVAFTTPWRVNRRYRRLAPDTFVSDASCNESQHSPIVNGQTQFILPNDPPGYLLGPMPIAPKK